MDLSEKDIKGIEGMCGVVDYYHIALFYGNPKYRHMLKKC